jgi:hypothetical protein
MKDLMLQLEEAGFEFDSYDNRFVKDLFHECQAGIQINDMDLTVSIIGDSDEEWTDLETFRELEDAIDFVGEL